MRQEGSPVQSAKPGGSNDPKSQHHEHWLVRFVAAIAMFAVAALGWSPAVQALSAKDYRGQCKTEYQQWKKMGGFGAAALSSNGHCGFTWNFYVKADARSWALRWCGSRGKGLNCTVVDEKAVISEFGKLWGKCERDSDIGACEKLATAKDLNRSDHAGAYNLLGNILGRQGRLDAAFDSYTKALKLDNTHGWANMNRSYVLRGQGLLKEAIVDAENAIKYFRFTDDDYRSEARKLIAEVGDRLKQIRTQTDSELCRYALASGLDAFETRGFYLPAVDEVKRRGLSLSDCQGKPNIVNRVPAPTPAKNVTVENAAGFTDARLCSLALTVKRDQWERGTGFAAEVDEAARRGKSVGDCRTALGLTAEPGEPAAPIAVAPSTSDLAGLDTAPLCRAALDGPRLGWEKSNFFAGEVNEARRRGLEVSDCRAALGLTNEPGPYASLDDKTVCAFAISPVRLNWSSSADGIKAQAEVKRRGGGLDWCMVRLGIAAAAPAPASPPPAATVARGKRLALVVGNAAYRQTRPLLHTDDDARLIAASLEKTGFTVTMVTDADQVQLKRAMIEFGRALRQGAEAGLFYYAGHGVQVNGRNYLIPIDAAFADESEVAIQSIDVNDFLQTMERAPDQVKIVVLDACRDNPFASAFRSAAQGLASVDAPRGTLVAYSTSPGKVAADGLGANSPYTTALAEMIVRPGVKLEDVFKQTRVKVLSLTGERQLPWESSSLIGDFYFVPEK